MKPIVLVLQLPAGKGGGYPGAVPPPAVHHPGGGPASGVLPHLGPVYGVQQRASSPAETGRHSQGF